MRASSPRWSPLSFSARFARPDGAAVRACRQLVWLRSRRTAVSLRRNERASLSRRRSGVPSRSFLPQQKRRPPFAQVHKAAVRGATPRGFAKQTEKGENDDRGELARIRLRFPFFTKLPRLNSSQLPTQTQVLWYFLDARKYRPPPSPLPPFTSQPLQTPRRTRDRSTCRKPLRSRRAQPAAAQDRFPAE